ncbi:MAG: GNAT family N-acetyltransferase [Myxococcales bacterium]|nr:GNAT family N-acetyltransferase [Myxococcales bacterium]
MRTERLLLRAWRESDLEPFARLNADPVVMEHFPAPLGRTGSDELARRIGTGIERDGYGLWAVETPDLPFAGYVGLAAPRFEAHFTPAVEVGWRLAREAWGRGYATEGARAAVAYGFGTLGLSEIVSFTVPRNVRSRRVMEKLGMTHDPADDFDHPALLADERMRRHVLYRLRP